MNNFVTGDKFTEIAQKADLDEKTSKRYIEYMLRRWSGSEYEKCKVGYAGEWAFRFKHGEEYAYSDLNGQAILRKLES